MTAVKQLTYAELCERLKPYGCKRLTEYRGCLEIWETGWGEIFTQMSDDGTYDEWLYKEAKKFCEATKPADWKPPT
jgi:hypothetical protein